MTDAQPREALIPTMVFGPTPEYPHPSLHYRCGTCGAHERGTLPGYRNRQQRVLYVTGQEALKRYHQDRCLGERVCRLCGFPIGHRSDPKQLWRNPIPYSINPSDPRDAIHNHCAVAMLFERREMANLGTYGPGAFARWIAEEKRTLRFAPINPETPIFRMRCYGCNEIFDSAELQADLDGPAFEAYYCRPCVAKMVARQNEMGPNPERT